MSLRIALCLSGQMRTYRLCHDALKRYLLDPVQPDIFIHTWSKSGLALVPDDRRSTAHEEETITHASMEALYRPKALIIEEFQESYSDEMGGTEAPEALRRAEPGHYKTALPMFYKMAACNALKSAHERSEHFTYDLVIRMRPDLMLQGPIPERLLHEPETLWFSDYQITLEFQVSDKLLVGASHLMDAYCSIWEMLPAYWEAPLGDGSPWQFRVGERLAFHHVNHLKLPARPFHMACFIERGRGHLNLEEEWRTTLGRCP